MRLGEVHNTIELWRSQKGVELPTYSKLLAIADRPLPDEAKMPISSDGMANLTYTLRNTDTCTTDDIELLFRRQAGAKDEPHRILMNAVEDPFPSNTTQQALIFY